MLNISYPTLVLVHLVLGFVIYTFNFVGKIYFAGFILYFLFQTLKTQNRNHIVLIAAGYTTGFEVFSRMTHSAFSYEFAKYMVIIFLLMGMFFKSIKRNAWPFFVFIFLLTPGVLLSAINLDYESNVANAIGFNLTGPVCLAIAAIYCYDRSISKERFREVLNAVLLPIISTTVYLYLYTPTIKDVLTGTASNFATSGGFGPNQVATVLGLGCFILFVRIVTVKNFKINLLDIALLGLMAYRGIVTFSRGGMLTAAICIVLFLTFYFLYSNKKEITGFFTKLVLFAITLSFVWVVSTLTTGGLINKRYSNENAAGIEKEDVTTGRVDLLNKELEAFYDNPFLGIGVGKIREYRLEETGKNAATHNEVSRILSEHGLFGLIGLAVLFLTPLIFRISNRTNVLLYSFFAFWFLTINHSSMRIAAPAFMYGLIFLTILSEKQPTLHRE